jgi:diguanylate cyclase (GGDEF)-like protein
MNINIALNIIKKNLFAKVVFKRIVISVSAMIIFLLIAGSLFSLYNRKILIEDGWEVLALEKQTFSNMIQSSINDALFFQDLLVNELSSTQNRSYQQVIDHMTKHFKYFHDVNNQYDQIRFIDIKGNEVIRTNWNNLTHKAQKDMTLQNKKHRYYFKNAIALKNNEVYISPLDFNMEHKKIVTPYQPTIRVATPVILNNKKLGIIVINIAIPAFIDQLKRIDKLSKGNIIFISSQGYCIMHSPSKYKWSHLLKKSDKPTFPILYPKATRPLLSADHAERLMTKYGIFLCNPLHKTYAKFVYSDLNTTLLYFLPYYTIFGFSPWLTTTIIIFFLFLAFLIGWLWGNLKLKQMEFEKTLKKMARTDALTGLMNRYAFHEQFNYEKERVTRYPAALSIAMIDIDHFKQLNDKYGHIIADEILRKLSSILKETLRKVDYICRFGGEEFVILLPETNLEQAIVIIERIRKVIEKYKYISKEKQIQFTISAGITQWKDKSDTIDKILFRVDQLLYQAKNQGRNKVVAHS